MFLFVCGWASFNGFCWCMSWFFFSFRVVIVDMNYCGTIVHYCGVLLFIVVWSCLLETRLGMVCNAVCVDIIAFLLSG